MVTISAITMIAVITMVTIITMITMISIVERKAPTPGLIVWPLSANAKHTYCTLSMNDVKEHAMYVEMDWEALESKVVVAPWTPEGPAPHPDPDSIDSSNDVYRGDQVKIGDTSKTLTLLGTHFNVNPFGARLGLTLLGFVRVEPIWDSFKSNLVGIIYLQLFWDSHNLTPFGTHLTSTFLGLTEVEPSWDWFSFNALVTRLSSTLLGLI